MNIFTANWKRIINRNKDLPASESASEISKVINSEVKPMEIPLDDPFLAYVHTAGGLIDLDDLKLESPTVEAMRVEGISLVLPLISHGELIGLINLGPRRSEQEYSSDDKRLLQNLATQAAPALRVAQLAQQQQAEARQRERIDQELRVARVIQETLLPKEVPTIEGWNLATLWQPAREVSGDFYDFVHLQDGRLAVIIADVTDKGVPAAMVMATTRSILRAQAEHLGSPGKVLARTNDLLHPDIPDKMFVTCLYMVIEPADGKVILANAGHNLPYVITDGETKELRATGMPLGLMPGMEYREIEASLTSGQTLVLSSDGLVEAHNDQGEMYGFGRFKSQLAALANQGETIPAVMKSWHEFTGEDHEQEDDITLVSLRFRDTGINANASESWDPVTTFDLPSRPGEERQASQRVLEALKPFDLPAAQERRLGTAVAEATMNAMEHGNHYQEDIPVKIEVLQSDSAVAVRIRDFGKNPIEDVTVEPDIDAKLAGQQSPRGWGLFLIKNLVDDIKVTQDDEYHTIELILYRQV
ncbi:MAG: SpoIIE family protein phosphatase [Chloroflexota bacterium]|nr:MAG: SpoIIE family protein phosphatase [Chloroflexota bacterium]